MRAHRARIPAALLAVTLGALSRPAEAQQNPNVEFSVQRFAPAPGADNFLGVETLRMNDDLGWSIGLFFNYARNPFVVDCTSTNSTCGAGQPSTQTDVVKNLLTWDLLASITPTKWLQIGLRIPVTYLNGDGLDLTTGGPLATSLHAAGLGDPYLEAKARVFGKPGGPIVLGLGADIAVAAHGSTANNFISDSSPVTGGVRGILEGTLGKFEYGGNLRALLRKDVTIGATTVGSEFNYGVAAGFNFTPRVELLAEGFGGTGFRSEKGSNSLEIDGALKFRLGESRAVALTLGGGGGPVPGVGVPPVRVFAGLIYAPGSTKEAAKLPAGDLDTDGDGIPDSRDKCPTEPETFNGYQDADGCPDELPDRDQDGVPDALDKCPDAGGTTVILLPQSPYYGCPDRDHDGVPDYLDKCPDVPEPKDDQYDGSGCPHPPRDTDHDGIPDDVDKCPTEPETYNGYQDADGCPDTGPTAVEIKNGKIEIHDRVEFALGKDKIQGKKSFQVLDAVAGILVGHKEITKVEVQGHTDNIGVAAQNRTLSQKRAEACVQYLVSKGVDASRLVAKGYGPDKPIGNNKTAAGRQENRRVEFLIAEEAKKPSPAPLAPPAAPPPSSPPPPPSAPPATPPPAPPPGTKPN